MRKKHLFVCLDKKDLDYVIKKAKQMGISRSCFMRRLLTGINEFKQNKQHNYYNDDNGILRERK